MESSQGYSQPPQSSRFPDFDLKSHWLAKNDKRLEALQDEIHLLYIVENKSLKATMETIKEKIGFEASIRKWKMKLKEWGYEKHLSEQDMKILVAKAERRAREEGKATLFLHNGMIMPESKFETFKKRKSVRESFATSPSNPTPLTITYFTPLSNPKTSFLEKICTTSNTPLKTLVVPSDARQYGVDLSVENSPGEVSSHQNLIKLQTSFDIGKKVDFILERWSNDPTRAAKACYNSIDAIFKQTAFNLGLVCRSLFKLGNFQRDKGLTKECIATYRGGLALLNKNLPSDIDIRKLVAEQSITLANILSFEGQSMSEAAFYYRLATSIFKEIKQFDSMCRCLLDAHLGKKNGNMVFFSELLHKALYYGFCGVLRSYPCCSITEVFEVLSELRSYYEQLGPSTEPNCLDNYLSDLSHCLLALPPFENRDALALTVSFAKLADALLKHGEAQRAYLMFDLCLESSLKTPRDVAKMSGNLQTTVRPPFSTQAHQSWTELKTMLCKDTDLLSWQKQRIYLDWYSDPEQSTDRAVEHFNTIFSEFVDADADADFIFNPDIPTREI